MPRVTECICGSSVRQVPCSGLLQPQIVPPYSWGQIRMRNAMNPAYTKLVFVNHYLSEQKVLNIIFLHTVLTKKCH